VREALAVHGSLLTSRDWGLENIPELSRQAASASGVPYDTCVEYFAGLDYRLSYPHLAGLSEFFRRLVSAGRVPDGQFAFLPAA
jgi:chorismate dehydratase